MESKIIHGDCLEVLRKGTKDSIDLVVTDPPYGYSFMGKDWDKAVPSVEIWKECLRVLKPGAFAFVMSAPRQDVLSQMIVRLTEAGFDTHFTSLYWTYASGFPKAMNVSKAVDKRMGMEREHVKREREDGKGTGKNSGSFLEGSDDVSLARSEKPNTPEAKALDGSYGGFQPKPAVEVIIVAMKPLSEKTYVDQALKNGKGVTWLDDARIPTAQGDERSAGNRTATFGTQETQSGGDGSGGYVPSQQGRFPANIIVSDDALNDGKVRKSGYSGSYSRFFSLDQWWTKACDTWPTLRDVVSQGALLDIEGDRSNEYIVSAGALERLYRNLDKVAGSVLGGGSWQTCLQPNEASYEQNWKSLQDSPNDCLADFRLDDVRTRLTEEGDQELLRRLDDVHTQFHLGLRSGDRADSDERTFRSYSFLVTCFLLPIISEVVEPSKLPESVQKTFPFLIVPKASKREKNEGCEGLPEKAKPLMGDFGENPGRETPKSSPTPRANHHPTTKPLTLMSYLITLGSRPSDTILDPFVGSGTTICSAKMLGRKGVGIEREEEYVKIAQARLDATKSPIAKP